MASVHYLNSTEVGTPVAVTACKDTPLFPHCRSMVAKSRVHRLPVLTQPHCRLLQTTPLDGKTLATVCCGNIGSASPPLMAVTAALLNLSGSRGHCSFRKVQQASATASSKTCGHEKSPSPRKTVLITVRREKRGFGSVEVLGSVAKIR